MRISIRALSLVLILGVPACASDTDDRPVSWSYIHSAIIVPNCATSGCHSTLTKTFSFDFENKQTALDIFRSDGAPTDALFRGQDPSSRRMPPDQPLPDVDIELIDNWVRAGELDN